VIPFLKDPVDFLTSSQRIALESQMHWADDTRYIFFQMYRSSAGVNKPLPWLDADQALFIAVNTDVGMALDYRSDRSDLRVVASDWSDEYKICNWREVSFTFTDFVRMLNLC
jgi:hypothetical protein